MSKPIALFKKFEKNITDWKWFFLSKKSFGGKIFIVKKIVGKKEFSIEKNSV